MSETEVLQVNDGGEEATLISDEEEMKKLVRDAVHSLPFHAVKDLLSSRVCPRCIFRFFGINGPIYYCSSLSPSILCSFMEELQDSKRCPENGGSIGHASSDRPCPQETEAELSLCCICFGILQFYYCDDKNMLVNKGSANEFAVSIGQLIKQEGYEIDSFSLEVSIPEIIVENDHAIWSYLKGKYGSEYWWQEKLSTTCLSVKDALKLSITSTLKSLLDVKPVAGSFRIRLTYTCPSSEKAQEDMERNGGPNNSHLEAEVEGSDSSTNKSNNNKIHSNEASDSNKLLAEKAYQPCHLKFHCYRTPVYIGGRYLKYSRNVSQTCWIIDDERKGEASVEEIIGSNLLPVCHGEKYKFHAAGREDIDVRMVGSGRPFLVEIQNARHIPSELLLKDAERKINSIENKLVGVKNLKLVGSEGWSLMREGEAEKQKQYAALVWISRPLEDDDLKKISSLIDMKISQKTPIRVLHRRSPLEREKIIHWMKIERIAGSVQFFLLHLCTQAGTYIKEFVHGDLGRTRPSIGAILGCTAEILQLDVTDVKMECF
ncbi:hypothetical protein RJ641_032542 [Dillenia turbinata]|uniref:tRNA pseudouridine(55) synthase n=1 Tax=Dillenia turbinata TaxID=194707 RepID=A0AAN8VWG0_9MAGN